jgi:hypothetical protein
MTEREDDEMLAEVVQVVHDDGALGAFYVLMQRAGPFQTEADAIEWLTANGVQTRAARTRA